MKIALTREGKIPVDHRVPIIPEQALELAQKYRDVELLVQSSEIRAFKDAEYSELGLKIMDSIEEADVIFGVKESPIDKLVEGKTYFFFSHTMKKQPYNRDLLRAILDKKIRLIDYEMLTDKEGVRLVAFGRYAGIVGAYNGILTYGKRYNLFQLRPAHTCFDLEDLKTEYKKVKLPKIKIALTGGGRVAKGAMEVLYGMGLRHVTPAEYLEKYFDEPVFTQLNTRDYNRHMGGQLFNRGEFYRNPELYASDFHKYARCTDVLIAAAYWDPNSPVLFKREDILNPDFEIKVIADITCDIEGSIPSTKRSSTIDDPLYDYNPSEDKVESVFRDEGNITVMAVDNLPCELPRNASEDFGKELVAHVIPALIDGDEQGVVERATITRDGKLTERFSYLQGFVDGSD